MARASSTRLVNDATLHRRTRQAHDDVEPRRTRPSTSTRERLLGPVDGAARSAAGSQAVGLRLEPFHAEVAVDVRLFRAHLELPVLTKRSSPSTAERAAASSVTDPSSSEPARDPEWDVRRPRPARHRRTGSSGSILATASHRSGRVGRTNVPLLVIASRRAPRRPGCPESSSLPGSDDRNHASLRLRHRASTTGTDDRRMRASRRRAARRRSRWRPGRSRVDRLAVGDRTIRARGRSGNRTRARAGDRAQRNEGEGSARVRANSTIRGSDLRAHLAVGDDHAPAAGLLPHSQPSRTAWPRAARCRRSACPRGLRDKPRPWRRRRRRAGSGSRPSTRNAPWTSVTPRTSVRRAGRLD
jgi:hypothetical protein